MNEPASPPLPEEPSAPAGHPPPPQEPSAAAGQGPSAAGATGAPAAKAPEKSRRWFVALAWVTLILFGIFVAGITLVAATLPKFKQSGQERVGPRGSWEDDH